MDRIRQQRRQKKKGLATFINHLFWLRLMQNNKLYSQHVCTLISFIFLDERKFTSELRTGSYLGKHTSHNSDERHTKNDDFVAIFFFSTRNLNQNQSFLSWYSLLDIHIYGRPRSKCGMWNWQTLSLTFTLGIYRAQILIMFASIDALSYQLLSGRMIINDEAFDSANGNCSRR